MKSNFRSKLSQPRQILNIKPSKYEVAEAIHSNKKYWKNIFVILDNSHRGQEKSRYAALDREISKDIKAERRSDHVKCFERSLPRREQWRTPHNDTKNQWKSARHVPKDLITLKTVWEGITNLRSVKEYCRWMIEHPEYRRAPYLRSLGMFDKAVLDARLTFELQDSTQPVCHTDIPAPIEHIRKRLSDLIDPNNTLQP